MYNKLKALDLNSLWRDALIFLSWITSQEGTLGLGGEIMTEAGAVVATRAAAIGVLEEVVEATMVVVEAAAEEEASTVATEEEGAVVAEEVDPMEVMKIAAEVVGMIVVINKREI